MIVLSSKVSLAAPLALAFLIFPVYFLVLPLLPLHIRQIDQFQGLSAFIRIHTALHPQTLGLSGHSQYGPNHNRRLKQAAPKLQQRQIKYIPTHLFGIFIKSRQSHLLLQPLNRSHNFEVEPQQNQYLPLHIQNLLLLVKIHHCLYVSAQSGCLDFLIFGSHEKTGHSQQLVPLLRYELLVAVSVYKVDCEVKGSGTELHPMLQGHQPSHQFLPHHH